MSLGTTGSRDRELKRRDSILVTHDIANRVVTSSDEINVTALSRVVEVISSSSEDESRSVGVSLASSALESIALAKVKSVGVISSNAELVGSSLGSLVVTGVNEGEVVAVNLDSAGESAVVADVPGLSCVGGIREDLGVAGKVLHIVLGEVCLACDRGVERSEIIGDVVGRRNGHLVVSVATLEDVLVVVDVEAGSLASGLDGAGGRDGDISGGGCSAGLDGSGRSGDLDLG